MKKYSVVMMSLVLFNGCVSTTVYDTETRRAAASVRVYKDTSEYPKGYVIIQEVKGQHCQFSGYKEPSTEKAMQELRLATAKVGGKGVINVACQDTGAIFPCGDSVTCFGDAI